MVEYQRSNKAKQHSALAQKPAPMKYLSRVVWSEGMYLGPHHFQVQSRYFEDTIRFATSALWFEPWGLGGCSLDPEALRNGTISLLHARGMFPDGLAFHMPESDPAPGAASDRRPVSTKSRVRHCPAYGPGTPAEWIELRSGGSGERAAHAICSRKATSAR